MVPRGEVFRDDVVPSVYINLPSDSLDAVLDPTNIWSDYHYKATFVFDNGTIRDTVHNVGFRLRGNTSRKAAKKSFKVSFNEYEEGQKFHGLEKMNINGEHNDPSIIRSKLCFDMLEYLEVPASRVNHVKLYLNGAYYGVYANVEHIDEEFTKSRYGNKGNLYKCGYGANLTYRGSTGASYRKEYYEIRQENSPTAYKDLAHFIDVLNNTKVADFECELEKVFNVNSYLKCMVVDVLTGNWDGPLYNKNNFYLFYNSDNQQFEYIPFDLDNTFGVDFLGEDWSNRNIYSWSKGGASRPLYQKLLANSSFRKRFTLLMDKTLQEYYNEDHLTSKIYALKSLINDAALEDPYRSLDYGFTEADFHNSFGYFSAKHVDYGIVDFVKKRATSAVEQLDSIVSTGPLLIWYSNSIDYINDSITFRLSAIGDTATANVELVYNWDAQSAIWSDTMRATQKGDYTFTLYWPSHFGELAYLFKITDKAGLVSNYPACNMITVRKRVKETFLFINELMADNTNGIFNDKNQQTDWVELYYNGANYTTLNGYYLTDNISEPHKFALPSKTIAPNSYTVFWADGETDLNHLPFKLTKAGEELALFNSEGVLVDMIYFGRQETDKSLGRQTDAAETWVVFDKPTPFIANGYTGNVNEVENTAVIYPNPSSGIFRIKNPKVVHLKEIYDTQGRLVPVPTSEYVDLTAYPNGVYFARCSLGKQEIMTKLIKLN